jgi:hypothetical protein
MVDNVEVPLPTSQTQIEPSSKVELLIPLLFLSLLSQTPALRIGPARVLTVYPHAPYRIPLKWGFISWTFEPYILVCVKLSSFLHHLTERVPSDVRFDLCLVVSFQSSFSGPNIPICTPNPPSSLSHPSCLWPLSSYSHRTEEMPETRLWSDKHSQILTSCPWKTLEIRADSQADSPLGGNMDVCRNSIRDRFVLLYPHWPARVTNWLQLLVW